MKKFIVNLIYNIGDLISDSFLCNWSWGYDLASKILFKSVSLQDKWKLDEPWKYPNK